MLYCTCSMNTIVYYSKRFKRKNDEYLQFNKPFNNGRSSIKTFTPYAYIIFYYFDGINSIERYRTCIWSFVDNESL